MSLRRAIIRMAVEDRYRLIGETQKTSGADVSTLGMAFGLCKNTIRSAIAWTRHPYELGRKGRPPLLHSHHIDYIRLRTAHSPRMTNSQLADEMSAIHPDSACLGEFEL